MHISEGVLSGPVLGVGWALTIAGTALGLRRMDFDKVMTVAILAAVFFVATLIHVPVGPSNVHLILNGLLGVILGWAAFPAILAGLTLQAVFFQYGGLAVLGVNTFDMAFPALVIGLALRPFMARSAGVRGAAAFVGGFASVLMAGLFTSAALAFTDEGFLGAAWMILGAHVVVMVVEGFVTVFVVSFLARVQPEILGIPARDILTGAAAPRS